MATNPTMLREGAERGVRPAPPAPGPPAEPEPEGGIGAAIWAPLLVSVIMALRGLGANKMRAVLTMLGVIIGVGAVIIAIAIGEGSQQAVAESIQRLGTNVLSVRAGQQRQGNVRLGSGSSNTLKMEDAEAILRGCPSVLAVSPEVNRNAQVKYKSQNTNVSINGNGAGYPTISNHPVQSGRYFTEAELQAKRRVAVIGAETAQDLFDRESPVGKTIRIAGQNFLVVGLLKAKGGQGWRNPDDAVYVPVTTAMQRLFGMDSVQNITCQARSFALMNRAQEEIEALMRARHNSPPGGESAFRIFNQAELAETQSAQQETFSKLITYLAIVSLVVGGIGIMNIMLVSVTERTREIGVRKAIGAKRRDVLGQFLLEALFLSLVGGLLGVLFGVGGSMIVGGSNNWKVVINPSTVLMAFSFSAIVGVFFGFYPAFKASRLNPIEALRYE